MRNLHTHKNTILKIYYRRLKDGSAVMSMYTGAKMVVRTVCGNSKGFEVKVGMHQGPGLSPLLFVIVMEAISREFRVA